MKIGAYVIHIAVLVLIINIINTSMVNTVFTPIKKKNINFYTFFLPQGWNFFTKNPRDAKTFLYKYNNSKLERVTKPNNMHIFNRIERKKGAEFSVLLASAKNEDWVTTIGKAYDNINNTPHQSIIVKKDKYIELLDTGLYLIEKIDAIPWSWISNVTEKETPSKLIKLKLID